MELNKTYRRETIGDDGQPVIVMTRLGRLSESDRSFDIEFWQAHTTTQRWDAGFELAAYYVRKQGRTDPDAFRLDRSVESLQRVRREVPRGRRVRRNGVHRAEVHEGS